MMKWVLRIIDGVLYTSLLTASCATALCMATERLVSGSLPALHSPLHSLVFGSSLLVYNTPRILQPPGQVHSYALKFRPLYFPAFFTGMALTIAGLYYLSWLMIVVSSVLGLLAFAYFLPLLPFGSRRRIRDFGWLKITVLTGVWTIATSMLPILFWQKNVGDYPFEILIRTFFIFTLCIIFDLRDMQADSRNNITTLPQRVGIRNSYRLIDISLLLFAVFNVVQYVRIGDKERLAGGLLAAIITRLVSGHLRKKPTDRSYLLLADGVMIVYALLVMAG